jgi:hypothetical protein
MLALSVQQPYASRILAGLKTIEYRSWSTAHRGPLLIHAGLHPADPKGKGLPRGMILGAVDLVEVRRAAGGWAWILANPRPLRKPIRCKGRLRLFEVRPGGLGR